jgi:putative metalloprotease
MRHSALIVLALLLFHLPAEAAISEEQVRYAWREATRIAEMTELPLDIKDDNVPNAWVTAGKSVTVTTGLMNLLVREEEMFGVLTHEAGHAKLGHYESRMSNSLSIGLAAMLLSKVIDSSLGEVAVGIGANLATAGFSREQEVEADDFATDIAFRGGKDPTGLYTALERIALSGGKTQPSGFNSHPPDDRRLLRIKNRILERNPDAVFPEVKKQED